MVQILLDRGACVEILDILPVTFQTVICSRSATFCFWNIVQNNFDAVIYIYIYIYIYTLDIPMQSSRKVKEGQTIKYLYWDRYEIIVEKTVKCLDCITETTVISWNMHVHLNIMFSWSYIHETSFQHKLSNWMETIQWNFAECRVYTAPKKFYVTYHCFGRYGWWFLTKHCQVTLAYQPLM